MGFKVAARTILQLGAELISSDAVAFYELVKNAFDAKSKRVDITVVMRMPFSAYEELRSTIAARINSSQKVDPDELGSLRSQILWNLIPGTLGVESVKRQAAEAKTYEDLAVLLRDINYIEIADTGHGMSFDDLRDVYLTIGTRARREEREQQQKAYERSGGQLTEETRRPVLGEKGVGRLSTMRLGNHLKVKTSRAGEKRWNILEIDWTLFSHESEQLLEHVEVDPKRNGLKDNPEASGTTICISALKSDWTHTRVEYVARTEFSKLTDPFTPSSRYPIKLRFNKSGIEIEPFNRKVLDWAHAVVNGKFSHKGLRVSGKISYLLRQKEKYYELEGAHLRSVAGVSDQTLRSLGPFSFEFYWYNRQLLTAIDGIGNQKQVRERVAQWAGGLMLYRDGFRVFPYGDPEDDWLNLDKTALSSGSFRANRQQIIGRVNISSLSNPRLLDQTNREGLTETEEKKALVNILNHVILTEFRKFMERVDKEAKARTTVDIDILEERLSEHEDVIIRNLNLLIEKFPQIKRETTIVGRIRESVNDLQAVMGETKQLAKMYKAERSQTIHLAGVGLMVEVLAHELNRATSHTLDTLAHAESNDVDAGVAKMFATLESQLKTLQQRLRILDPLSTAGRQRKETFDLIGWVRQTLETHAAQFSRHSIHCRLVVLPKHANPIYRVTAVKGMIVQVLENLLSNSVYWLKQQRKVNETFKPAITVAIDTVRKEIRFTDNGPGVPASNREEVFQPFWSTKPPGQGKGLGLFISREIAHYHGGDLYLSDETSIHPNSLNTFVFSLEANGK